MLINQTHNNVYGAFFIVALVTLFTIMIPANGRSATLHVGSGYTYSTIAAAINASSSGDTIYVHSGTYIEQGLRPKSGIDQTHPTIISGLTGETRPIISANAPAGSHIVTFDITGVSYITLQYLDIRGGGGAEQGTVTIGNDTYSGLNNYITIQYCKISQTNNGGSLTQYNPAHIRIGYGGTGSHISISNNELTGAYASGLKIYSRGCFTDISIKNNYIHDVLHGVSFKWGDDVNRNCTIENNIITNCSQRSIYCDQSYVTIKNNILDTSVTGIVFGDNWGGSYCNVTHNTIYGAGNALYFAYGANNLIQDNILYSASTITDYSTNNTKNNNLTTNPMFTNAANHDFTLLPSSPAIGRATDGNNIGVCSGVIVGIVSNSSTPPDTTPPSTPTNVGITILQ